MKYIKVWVDPRPTTDYKEIFSASLRQNASLQEIHKDLKLAVDIHIAGRGTKQKRGGQWKYQLLSRDLKRVINKTSIYLKTDDDYHELVTKTKGHGKEKPIAILTQEKAEPPDAECEAADIEGSDRGDLDVEDEFDGFESKYESKNEHLEKDDTYWDDSRWEEPVDENGRPWFDANDPAVFDRVYTKYGEAFQGPIDEGHWTDTLTRR